MPGFRSLLGDLPHNTIVVYSYSKYFGCTGWRLGVIARPRGQRVRPDDRRAARGRPEARSTSATGALTLEPREIKFIDRIVADSRDVALNHTAGLSHAIAKLNLPEADRLAMANRIPVAFAVTYLVGVVGAAWFLAQLAPRLMGINLEEECRLLRGGTGRARDYRQCGRDIE